MNKFGRSTEEDFQTVAYVIKEMITLSYEGFSARASIVHGVTSGHAAVYSDYQGYIPFKLSGSLSAKRQYEEEFPIRNLKRPKVLLPYTNTNCGSSKYPEGHSHDRDGDGDGDDDDDDDDGASSAVSEGSRSTDVEEDDEAETEDDSEAYSEDDSSGCSVVESE
jgi:hypothetical protein